MPLRPKKGIIKRTDGGGLTGPELEDLILGFTFFDEPFSNDQERRECWKKNRAFIILKRQGEPGEEATGFNRSTYDFLTRPQAWFAYDAPGRRRFISCTNDFCPFFSECPVAKNIPTETPDCLFRKGEPHTGGSFDGLFRLECVGHKVQIFLPAQESTADFLQRHGLLTVAEEKYLQKHPELLEPEAASIEV